MNGVTKMSLHKQAKSLSSKQISVVRTFLSTTRNPLRNDTIFLLSCKAGLRAKEIASITWRMILDSDMNIDHHIHLTNVASKGNSGRIIPINKELKSNLIELYYQQKQLRSFDPSTSFVIRTERSHSTSAQAIVNMFASWYNDIGLSNCSSHSGRRTFITQCSRKITSVGGSLRDVQQLAGHTTLQTTQRYIDADSQSKIKVVDLI